jgi:hypothetical protein
MSINKYQTLNDAAASARLRRVDCGRRRTAGEERGKGKGGKKRGKKRDARGCKMQNRDMSRVRRGKKERKGKKREREREHKGKGKKIDSVSQLLKLPFGERVRSALLLADSPIFKPGPRPQPRDKSAV